MGDFDVHIGNIGVIRNGSEKPRLVRIDYGWAFSNLTKDKSTLHCFYVMHEMVKHWVLRSDNLNIWQFG